MPNVQTRLSNRMVDPEACRWVGEMLEIVESVGELEAQQLLKEARRAIHVGTVD